MPNLFKISNTVSAVPNEICYKPSSLLLMTTGCAENRQRERGWKERGARETLVRFRGKIHIWLPTIGFHFGSWPKTGSINHSYQASEVQFVSQLVLSSCRAVPCLLLTHTSAVRSFLFSENTFHRVHSTLNTQLPLNALTSAQFTQTWRTERYIANCKRKWERGRGVDTAIGCRKRNRNSSSSNYYQTFCTICNDFFPPSCPKRDKLRRESSQAQENCTSCCSFSVFWLFFLPSCVILCIKSQRNYSRDSPCCK